MRSLTTAFQISIYGLVLLSCLMMAYAEGVVFPEALSVPLVVMAWLFTERFQVLRLPPWGANALGFAAFGLAFLELLGNSVEARLLSGAHLLVYLTWVVLFQKKSSRHYWWLCALSVLQVAVGSVLTTSGVYGGLLFLYFCGTIWTLSLFSLWQMQDRFAHEVEGQQEAPPQGAPPRDGAVSGGGAIAPGVSRDKAPFAVLRRASQARGTMHVDPLERWLGLRFALRSAVTAGLSMIMASVFFLMVPRFWVGSVSFGSDSAAPAVRSLTGFTEKVRLGDIGRIMESTEPVLVMKLFDNETNAELSVEEYAGKLGYEEPLFRGAILTLYNRGDWTGKNLGNRIDSIPRRPLDDERRVRQEITLQPIGTDILLAMHPVREVRMQNSDQDVGRYLYTSELALADKSRPRTPQTYFVYSPLPGRGTTNPFRFSVLDRRIRRAIREKCIQLPPKGLERLKEEARRVAGLEDDAPRPPDRDMAERLVHWLRDSGEFEYSLDSSIQDRDLDPVEDFLLNRRRGHCEYYASALALMLRSLEIPAVLVSGFKGGKVNRITGAFEVEQRHAHAWVEAVIDDRWTVLDATPGEARSVSVEALEPQLPTFHDLMTFVRDAWSLYVVNMNIGHQRDRFYAPLQDLWGAASETFLGKETASRTGGLLGYLKFLLVSSGEGFGWQRTAVIFFLLGFFWASVWVIRRLWALWKGGRLSARAARAVVRRRVEFYERFQKLCTKTGLTRRDDETQREFGDAVGTRWEPVLAGSGLQSLPEDLAELFYRVRFGEDNLSDAESAALEVSLARLESALQERRTRA